MDRSMIPTHNRSFGCRIRRWEQDRNRMVTLENGQIRVSFAQDKGTDIVEFVHKASDTDCMWRSFQPLKPPGHVQTVGAQGGSFLEYYAGGWQELFPTYGGRAEYAGASIGVHGEVCLYPWECTVLCDTPERVSVRFSLRTFRSPFLVEKTVSLEQGSHHIEIAEAVTNEGSAPREFMWGHHPAFGYPFLDEAVRLEVAGVPRVCVPAHTAGAATPFDRETEGDWPSLPGRDGKLVDMSRARAPEDRLYMEYYLHAMQEGRYRLHSPNRGVAFELEWDLAMFPYLWVWGLYCGLEDYPWYGRAYVMAVEPWSSMPGDYAQACANGSTRRLAPGETATTTLRAGLSAIE